jgi:acyl-CoA thioester hydrolase
MRRKRWSDIPARFLPSESTLRVRFQEVDVLGVAWHGHYLTYFEEGRNAFGREYSFDYDDLRRAGLVVPLVHLEVDYFAPARFNDVIRVSARLHPADGAWIPFRYRISDARGAKLATGTSVQVFTDLEGNLMLTPPRFYRDFLERWKSRLVEG